MTKHDNADEVTRLRAEVTVCIAHGCFVPCRRDGEHRLSTNPFWVKSVRDYQGSADQSLTWEPAWERTRTGAAPSEGHSEARSACTCMAGTPLVGPGVGHEIGCGS